MTTVNDIWQYRWGWKIQWFGWSRMLWLTIALDFRLKLAYIVVFGLAISYGRQLIEIDYVSTTESRVEK